MKALAKISVLAGALIIVACAPKAVVVERVTPTAQKVQVQVKEANESSAKLEKRVNVIHSDTQALGRQIAMAVAEADRLRKQGLATQEELDAQYLQMVEIESRNLFLEASTKAAVANADEQRKLREAAEARIQELLPMVEKQDQNVETLKKEIVKSAENAAIGKTFTKVAWMASIVLGLGLVAWIVSKVIK